MITSKKILCPVDFFPASDAAVSYAAGLAANYGAGVHLLHVVTPLTPFASTNFRGFGRDQWMGVSDLWRRHPRQAHPIGSLPRGRSVSRETHRTSVLRGCNDGPALPRRGHQRR
jgi:hypothetical protein